MKFLITTGISDEFYSSSEEFTRFLMLLRKITDLKIDNLSSISNELMNKLLQINPDKMEIREIENLFFSKFSDLNSLILSIGNEKKINREDIPDYFKKRFESSEGFYRYEVIPSKNVTRKENLEKFVSSVQTSYPDATGMPVVQIEAGK